MERCAIRTLALTFISVLPVLACNASFAAPEWNTVTANIDNTLCLPPANPIACENSKPGNDDWDIPEVDDGTPDHRLIPTDGDPGLQGFATDISVNRGEIVTFKIKSSFTYDIKIYRIGYYNAKGARLIATIENLPANQQRWCLSGPPDQNGNATHLVDCGNWDVSTSWAVPANATSGVYIAALKKAGSTSVASHIIFIVRDDAGASDILFQTSDTSWQAYNSYGGFSLYTGTPEKATKVSYNRPFNTRGTHDVFASNATWFFSYEYPMIRWLERNGYNVSYFTGVDSDRIGQNILGHKVFLSVGHDEYWSANQRANVEAARAAGVHLAFFSGNEVYWKTRWEDSVDGSGTHHRTLVSYKETGNDLDGGAGDPDPAWTGTWRDPSSSPPSDGGRPANALTASNFMVQVDIRALEVPWDDGKMRLWRNTGAANHSSGKTTLAAGCFCPLGYEWGEDTDNGFRPPGLIRASTTATPSPDGASVSLQQPNNTDPTFYLMDHGTENGYTGLLGTVYPGKHHAIHHLTLYRQPPTLSGALVFGAGTIGWSWGLDGVHDIDPAWRGPNQAPLGPSIPEPTMQQATINLFADMCDAGGHCVQPRTIQDGSLAAPSTDATPPRSRIDPLASSPTVGVPIEITGTACDPITGTTCNSGDGAIGGVEVSVDGGVSWHPATGHSNWRYSWKPARVGPATIKSRAVDDTGNLETTPGILNVNVAPHTSETLLFYNKVTGTQVIGRLSNTGVYTDLSTRSFAPNWTHIVTGTNNAVLFYRAGDGFTWMGTFDDAGVFADVGQPTYVPGNGWTHIVAAPNNMLLFYKSGTGEMLLARLDNNLGTVDPTTELVTLAPLSKRTVTAGWTHIVVGVNNVILFYNSNTGAAATARLGLPIGNYVELKQISALSPGWTHIVPGINNVLLFFKASPGNASSARIDDAGNFTYLHNPLWTADLGWTTIAAGVKNSTLLFYHAPSGTGAVGTLNENGDYVHIVNHNGFSTGWTHIISP